MSNNRGWKRFLAMLLSVTMLLSIVSIGYAEGATAQPAEVAETVAPAEEAPAELPSVDEIIVDVNRPETAWDEGDDFDLTAKAGSTLKAKISANAFQGEFINSQGILSLGAGGKYTFKVSDFEIVSGTTTANPELELVAVSVKRNSTKYIAYNRTEFRIKGNKANGMATVRVKVREKGTDNECVLDVKAKKVGAPTTFAISPATVIAPAEGATYVLTQGGLKGGVSQADTMLEVNPPVNAEVTYTVSPADGAVTVDANGKVTVAPVTAETLGAKYTVTATSYNGKKATLTINMAEEPVEPASKLVVTPAKTQLAINNTKDQTVNLTASVQGEAASLEGIKWKVDNAAATLKVDAADPTKATLTVPKTIVTPGKITVTATAGDLTGTAVIELDYAVASVEIDETALKGYASTGTTYEIPEGAKVQLTAKVTLASSAAPSAATYTGNIIWTSSQPAVATVDETGLVTVKTGVKDLSTVITATAQDKKDTITVKAIADYNTVVIKEGNVDVTGKTFYLDTNTNSRANKTLTATPTAKAAAAVTWSSSNSALATVTDGKVVFNQTAVGDVVITATAVNGATGSVTYKLISGDQTPDSIVIEGYGDTATVVAGSTVQLKAIVYAEDGKTLAAVQDVTWKVNTTNYATIDKDTGVLTVKGWNGVGNTTVTATSTLDDDVTKTLTVKVIPYAMTGLDLSISKADTVGMSGSGTKEDPYVLEDGETYTAKVDVTPSELGTLSGATLYTLTALDAKGTEATGVLSTDGKGTITVSAIDGVIAITATATDGSGLSKTVYVTKGDWKVKLKALDDTKAMPGQGTEATPWQYSKQINIKTYINGSETAVAKDDASKIEYRYNVGNGWSDWTTPTIDKTSAVFTVKVALKDVTLQVRSTTTPTTVATAYFKYVKTPEVLTADDVSVEVLYGTVKNGDGSFEKPYVFEATEKTDDYSANQIHLKVSVTNPLFSLSDITVNNVGSSGLSKVPGKEGEYKAVTSTALRSFEIKTATDDSELLKTVYFTQALASFQTITELDINKVDGKDVPADNSESNPLVLVPDSANSAISVTKTPATSTDTVNLRLEEKADETWNVLYTGTATNLNSKLVKTAGKVYRITAVAARSDISDVVYVKIANQIKKVTVSPASGITVGDFNSYDLPYTATSANPAVTIAITDPTSGTVSLADTNIAVYYKAVSANETKLELSNLEGEGWTKVVPKVDGTLELNLTQGEVYAVRAFGSGDEIDANATSNVFYVSYPYSTPTAVTKLNMTAEYKAVSGDVSAGSATATGTGTEADPFTFAVKEEHYVQVAVKPEVNVTGYEERKLETVWTNVTGGKLPLAQPTDPNAKLEVKYNNKVIATYYFSYKYAAVTSITLKVADYQGTQAGTFADPYVANSYDIATYVAPADADVDNVEYYKKTVTAAPTVLPKNALEAEADGYTKVTNTNDVAAPTTPGAIDIVVAFKDNVVGAMYVMKTKNAVDGLKLSFDTSKNVEDGPFLAIGGDYSSEATTTEGKAYVIVQDAAKSAVNASEYDWAGVTVQYRLGYYGPGDVFFQSGETMTGELTVNEKGNLVFTAQSADWYKVKLEDKASILQGVLQQPYAMKLQLVDKTGKALGDPIVCSYYEEHGLLGE